MIKFLDLQKINSHYADALKHAASQVIDKGWYLLGEQTAKFEAKLASFLNTPTENVVAVANGLDALRLILRAYRETGIIQTGDEVITPANTYIASILAITDNRLRPVLVEPSLETYNIDIEKIEAAITDKTKAVLVVHLYGRAVWSKQLELLAKKHNLIIIEDNAQAIGAAWHGCRTGALGDAAGFSFYPSKNLGALGDCGAVVCRDKALAKVVRTLANYGSSQKYIFDYCGYNSRMDEIQAAFLSVKIDYVLEENRRRREIAAFYNEKIVNPAIVLPQQPVDMEEHVYHFYIIRTQKRDALQLYLSELGIQTLIHYPIPPHKQACYQVWNHLSFPITEQIHREVLSLPMSQVLTGDEINYIVEAINLFVPEIY